MKYVALGLVALAMFTTSLVADSNALTEIRRAIEEKGARWTADVTSVSELTREEQRRLCGTTLESTELRPLEMGTPSGRAREEFSWTDYEGYNWLTHVQDQGGCGSCWAFGACGALEVQFKILADCPTSQIDLSEQYLINCTAGDCGGYNIPGTFSYIQYYGVVDEECVPYLAVDTLPCEDRCPDWELRLRFVDTWGTVPPTVENIKDRLYDGPLTVAFTVYQDFYSYNGGIYEHVWGGVDGGHCVVMCGYSDIDSCWVCKNSWGTGWGEDGYFRIKWGQCGMEQNAYWVTGEGSNYPFLYSAGETYIDVVGDSDGMPNPGETVEMELILENECTYADAYDIQAVLRTDEPMLAIVDSEAVFLDLAPGASGVNSQDPFTFEISDGASVGTYALTAYVTANEGTDHPYWKEIEIALDVTLNSSGWPFASGCAVKSSPALVDLNQDGTQDVIFGGEDGRLYALSSSGDALPGFPFEAGQRIWGAPAVGDLDSDGSLEVVFGSWDNHLYVLDDTGTLLDSRDLGDRIMATPALADLDGDGDLEIAVGTYGSELYVLHHDLSDFNGSFPYDLGTASRVYSGAAIADLDGDGYGDIIVGTKSGVHAVDASGNGLWTFGDGLDFRAAPSVADLDGSGPKVYAGSYDDTLYIIDSGGTEDTCVGTGGDISGSPAFCDLDGNDRADLIFTSCDGRIYAYDCETHAIDGWPIEVSTSIESSPCVSDIDGDDSPEVVAIDAIGNVYVFKGDGASIDYFPLNCGQADESSPAVADLDRDGDLEIVFGSTGGIQAIDVKESTTEGKYWHMHRGNLHRTGSYEDVLTDVSEPREFSVVPKTQDMFFDPVSPNPMTRELTLRFGISSPGLVDLAVYDASGRRVRTLLDGHLKSGAYTVTWDGADENGRKLGKGVYFCRIVTPGLTRSRSVVLLR